MQGKQEWQSVPTTLRPIEKIGDLKIFECAESVVTASSWQIIDLVIDCSDDNGGLRMLPFPGSLSEQPPWFRQAAKLLRSERNSKWFIELRKEVTKPKGR